MEFDQHGNISPYQVIETDLQTFEEKFVKGFPASQTRHRLFENYLHYVDEIKARISGTFYQWIDGSFVTQKPNPNDIDLVTFLDFHVYKSKEKEWEYFRNIRLERKQGIDGYAVAVYSEAHPLYSRTRFDRLEWLNTFGWSRPQRNGLKYPKGIIQLNFISHE